MFYLNILLVSFFSRYIYGYEKRCSAPWLWACTPNVNLVFVNNIYIFFFQKKKHDIYIEAI